jgi:hypothetical protein
MRSILIAATIVLAALGGPVLAQTMQDQPDLSDDQKKSQQNSADEASIKGRLEDGIKPGDPSEQSRANKQLEDAAVEAKRICAEGHGHLHEISARQRWCLWERSVQDCLLKKNGGTTLAGRNRI